MLLILFDYLGWLHSNLSILKKLLLPIDEIFGKNIILFGYLV
ncbi:hypothetical protein MNB_SV-4-451 [hydrothermal vent metagenome]|uniref:Uncharacterized protein n=1 Tax=hydrothermal vent metagenome TaxID=652676 RepID=A0A1W1EAK6_9ZZZZ